MGKSTISMAIFNSFLYVYQRVSGLHSLSSQKNMLLLWSNFLKGSADQKPELGNWNDFVPPRVCIFIELVIVGRVYI